MKACHDCKKQIHSGAEYMPYLDGEFIKCKQCHKIDPILRNFRETEVYSRVVGYIRPVSQWNKGKCSEFKDRTEYATY